MPVQAIKVGGLYSAEAASVAAQVAADYNQVPLVLHLGQRGLPAHDAASQDDADDLLAATLELVLPQTDLVVVEDLRLAEWHAEGDIDIGDAPRKRKSVRMGKSGFVRVELGGRSDR